MALLNDFINIILVLCFEEFFYKNKKNQLKKINKKIPFKETSQTLLGLES